MPTLRVLIENHISLLTEWRDYLHRTREDLIFVNPGDPTHAVHVGRILTPIGEFGEKHKRYWQSAMPLHNALAIGRIIPQEQAKLIAGCVASLRRLLDLDGDASSWGLGLLPDDHGFFCYPQ